MPVTIKSRSRLSRYEVRVFVYQKPDGSVDYRHAYLLGWPLCPASGGCIHEVDASSGQAAKGAAIRQHRSLCERQVPCISLYQPWASLLVPPHGRHRLKINETRGFAPPADLLGMRFVIHAAQRDEYVPLLLERLCYGNNMPPAHLPRGVALGTARMTAVGQMPEAKPADGSDLTCGNWEPGRFAWRFEEDYPFPEPIPLRGRQGIFWESAESLGL